MASKEATPEFYAFEFGLTVAQIGEKTTNPQVKSKVSEAFMGYGAFTETQVLGLVGAERTVIVFFARLFGKGQPAYDSLKKNETVNIKIYDVEVPIKLSGAKPSGGGATTGTSSRPKKEVAKAGGRGKPKAADKPKDGEVKDGEKKDGAAAGAAAAGGDKKDGGRGRGRGKKEDEVKGPSLQRGRANIGGKLGPVSKVRLAKIAKEKFEAENKARVARGEDPLPDPKAKRGDDDDSGLPPKKDAKAAGKKEGGKKEAGKAPAKAAGKAEGAKKGK